MAGLLTRVRKEIRATIARPGRVLELANPRKLRAHAQWLVSSGPGFEVGGWQPAGDASGCDVRGYRSYEDYLQHQRSKLEKLDLAEYDRSFCAQLTERLSAHAFQPGTTVLCLGARLGTEVRAFINHGCFAIGIDLNPGPDNRFVVVGDFHQLQYADRSVDVVFTNALDHALDLGRILKEVERVLAADGRFIVEAVHGSAEGKAPRFYESFYWATIDDLVKLIERLGFRLERRTPFDQPWPGAHLTFRK